MTASLEGQLPAKRQRLSLETEASDHSHETTSGKDAEGPAVLTRDDWFARAKAARERRNPTGPPIWAMYSSLVDGILLDPELMVLPLDDHAFVRGHAVFDTATLCNGRVYRLDIHLTRLFKSASDARLTLPFGPSEEENRKRMTDIVCRLCVASGRRDASIRFWLSAGPGNFGFTPAGCEAAFYCVLFGARAPPSAKLTAIDEVTVRSVPMKPPLLAELKSNNYMLNCLTAMDAQDRGGRLGILLHEDDTIGEGPFMNCAFVTKERVLLTPPFTGILPGTTVRRAMELARSKLLGKEGLLSDVRQEPVPLEVAKEAVEVMFFGGDTKCLPVGRWDGQIVGDGEVGPVAAELDRLLKEDAANGDEEHIQLAY